MKAYKGFNQDMTCRGFQYEEGKEYETGTAVICEKGFHACEYPLDCLNYYSPNESVYHEVEVGGDIDRKDGESDSKIAATNIKVNGRLSLAGLVKAAIEFTFSRTKQEANANEDYGASSATGYKGASSATGDYGASSATGDYGASSATGYKGASSATGYKGASSATGYCGASSATGYKGASSATGDYGASSATGYKGASSATGDYGASSATGNCGASSATGYCSSVESGDPESIAVAWGYDSKAKGVLGSHLVLAEWKPTVDKPLIYRQEHWKLVDVKLIQIDGETYKADTFYQLVDGEVIEWKNGDKE